MKKALIAAAAVAALAMGASAAQASSGVLQSVQTDEDFSFSDTGISSGSFTDNFVLNYPATTYDASVAIAINGLSAKYLTITGVTFDGTALSVSQVESTFGQTLMGFDLSAPQTLSISGTYAASSKFKGVYSGDVTLVPVSSAPEPSTWMLMIAGVALTGGALRYGRRNGWASAAA